MKKLLTTTALGAALLAGITTTASAGCSCTVKQNCTHGGYAYVKKYKKVAVPCSIKKTYKVRTKCVEVNSCKAMTCYKTKTKMVPSTCYKTVAYWKKVRVDSRRNIVR